MIAADAYTEFLSTYGKLTREAFFEEVQAPHLYVASAPDMDLDALFRTVQFVSGRGGSDTPSGPFNAARVAASLAPQGVLPLRKDGNAFSMMITLGRAPNNDISIADRRISKFHLYFRQARGAWTVTDANSTNGTHVDGIRLAPERSYGLRSGATIELGGGLRLLFLMPEDLYDLVQYSKALVAGCGWQPSLAVG